MAILNQQSLQYDSVRDQIVTKFNTEGPTDKRFLTFKVEHIDQTIATFTKRSQEKNVGDNPEWHRYRAEFAVWRCHWPEQKEAFPGIEPLRMFGDASQDCPIPSQSALSRETDDCSRPSQSATESETEHSTPEPEPEQAQPSKSPTNTSEPKKMEKPVEYATLEDSLKSQTEGSLRFWLSWLSWRVLIVLIFLTVLVAMYTNDFSFTESL